MLPSMFCYDLLGNIGTTIEIRMPIYNFTLLVLSIISLCLSIRVKTSVPRIKEMMII
jgi:hypothetical protein